MMGAVGSAFSAWDVWRRGSWPFADWLSTPLYLLAQVQAIDFVYQTMAYKSNKNNDWSKLSQGQMELIQWLSA